MGADRGQLSDAPSGSWASAAFLGCVIPQPEQVRFTLSSLLQYERMSKMKFYQLLVAGVAAFALVSGDEQLVELHF